MISRKQERLLKKISALSGTGTRITLHTSTRKEPLIGTVRRCEGDLMGDHSYSPSAGSPRVSSVASPGVPLWIFFRPDNGKRSVKLCYCEITGLEEAVSP